MTRKIAWTDGWGADRENEPLATFNHNDLEWATIWDEYANEFRTVVCGPARLTGMDAFNTLHPNAQSILFQLLMGEDGGDRRARNRVRDMLDTMTVEDMNELLHEAAHADD